MIETRAREREMTLSELEQEAEVDRRNERWNSLVETLKKLAAELKDQPGKRTAVLLEMASVYRERLKLDVMVVETLKKVLDAEPSNRQAMDELARQYESLRRWPDLLGVLRKGVLLVENPSEREALERRISGLERDHGGSGKSAPSAAGAKGKAIATVGASMIAASVIMGVFLGIPGATMHNILQLGGLLLGGVGIVMWRMLKI